MFLSRLAIVACLSVSAMAVKPLKFDSDLDPAMQLDDVRNLQKVGKANKVGKKALKGPKQSKPEVPKQMTKSAKFVQKVPPLKLQKAFKQIYTRAPTPAPNPPPLAQQTGSNQVTVIITTDDYPKETTFEVKNLQGMAYMAGGPYSGLRTTYSDTKFVPNGVYQFILKDTFGDGMCCQFGPGGYNLFLNGVLVKAGGTFASSETVTFTAGVSPPTNAPTNKPVAKPTTPKPVAKPTVKPVASPTNKPVAPSSPGNCGPTTVIVTTDDYPLETSWFVKDLAGQQVMGVSGGAYTMPRKTYSEEKCLPYAVYQFMIMDQKGDGMCCNFGVGGYNLFVNNALVKAGGTFASSDSVLFSSQGTPFTPPTAPIVPPPTNAPTNAPVVAPTNPPATTCGSTTVIVTTDDYPLETSWNIKNTAGAQVMGVTAGTYTGVKTTYSATQCLPIGIYTFMINDTKGDGICCTFGAGGYNLYANNKLIKAGGVFTTSESVVFNSDGSSVVPVSPPSITPAPVAPVPTPPTPISPPTPAPTNPTGPTTVASNNIQSLSLSSNPGAKMTFAQQTVFCNEKLKEAARSPTIGDAFVQCSYVNDVITTTRRRSLRFLQSTITQTVEFNMFYTSATQSKSQLETTKNDFPNQASTPLAKEETRAGLVAAGLPVTAVNNVVPTSSNSPSGKPSISGKPSRKPSAQPSGKPSGAPSGKPSGKPSRKPSGKPSGKPSRKPSGAPSGKPSATPSGVPCAPVATAFTQAEFTAEIAKWKTTPTYTPAINTWNTQGVTDMSAAFQGYTLTNPNVRCWNVASVQNMKDMFNGATLFDTDLSDWNVQQVTDMEAMFKGSGMTWDLNFWNADKVSDVSEMFSGARYFNGKLPTFTNKVTDMYAMFNAALVFNQPTNGLVTSAVTDMSMMFQNAINYNSAIFTNTGLVQDMDSMFTQASAFNQDISSWAVNQVGSNDATNDKGMQNMFKSAGAFNQNLDGWNPTSCKRFENMFDSATRFDGKMFSATSEATDMSYMFQNAISFTGKNIPNLDTHKVTDMGYMFNGASSFISTVATSSNKWNVQSVTSMEAMFQGATSFNQPVSTWTFGTGTIEKMKYMFRNANAFDNTLFDLDTTDAAVAAKVTDLTSMFEGATVFNQNINSATAPIWKTPNVATFTNMFKNAAAFDQAIIDWDMTDATTFNSMFYGATKFNQVLDDWNGMAGSKVTDFTSMFQDAQNFNTALAKWKPNADLILTGMDNAFSGATKFQQTLCAWNTVVFTVPFTTGTNTFLNTNCAEKPDLEGFSATNTDAAGKACFACS